MNIQTEQKTRLLQATTAPPQRNKQRMINNIYQIILIQKNLNKDITVVVNYQLPELQTSGLKVSQMVMRMLATKIVEEQLGEQKLQERPVPMQLPIEKKSFESWR